MKKSKFTEERIAFALRQVETGTRLAEVCRKMGISEQTCFRWKRKSGSLGVPELRRVRQLGGSHKHDEPGAGNMRLSRGVESNLNPSETVEMEPLRGECQVRKRKT